MVVFEKPMMTAAVAIGFAVAVMLATMLASCANPGSSGQASDAPSTAGAASLESEGGEVGNIPQTGFTEAVPADYRTASAEPGSVVRVEYGSRDYAGSGEEVTKAAYVYLPYGYDEADEDARYDIVYLMHGWGGHAGEYFEVRLGEEHHRQSNREWQHPSDHLRVADVLRARCLG
ncbi:MAG: hypothetical protein QM302_07390 [Acidobacteriota bacterium]|nr:hypothetical protein [Acidobacteriota bacterium]